MKENGKNKREWVKTAAIIFLSVMLVLTFFSQSIMNYSLPEVATSYAQSGTITAKIRGTGVVESGDPYEVKVTETRKVSSVAVKVGQTVQKGDVLLYLEDAESDELKEAKKALEAAQDEYELMLLTAEITSSNIYSATEGVSVDVYRKQITNAQAAVKKAEEAKKAAEEAKKAADAAVPSNPEGVSYEVLVGQIEQAIKDHETQIAYESSDAVKAQDEINVNNKQNALSNAEAAVATAEENYNAAVENGSDEETVNNAWAAVLNARSIRDTAQNEYNQAVAVKDGRPVTVANLQANLETWKLRLYNLQKDQTAATTTTDAGKKAAEEALAAAAADLETKEAELKALVDNIANVIKLEQLLDKIDDAQKTVDELTEKSVNATVTADIAGTVTQVNVTAGNNTSAATPVVVLQPEGAGYTLSFSVTNEQAKRLAVGDKADLVNAWRYDEVEVTLASIKPDKQDPGQKKQLTFNVTGNVTAGQSFSVSVGQKSANYDIIVPNSAIREDSNGKFVLIVESKPSPLGNRYMATRVDVEVLASDDTQSAVSGALNGYEYVITTANKPVEAGKLVRMPE